MKVLYREYRPDTFEALIGQDTVKAALQRALKSGRIAHAYLFSGPRGCGKTTSARIFARCLNCETGPTPTPCGKCDSCKELSFNGGGSADVIEMDAASHGGVDDARELKENALYAPSRDRYKIVILDEAHMITNQAFNALLKLVEEPPEHLKFIFATTEPEKVISTIRSRTYHYAFNLVPGAIMTPFLQDIVKKEGFELDERIYPLLVRVGGGSVRDTLSFLDQLISSAVNGKVEYEFAVKLFGFTPIESIKSALEHLKNSDFAALFDDVEGLVDTGISPKGFALDILSWLRDALLITTQPVNKAQRDALNLRAALGEHSEAELQELSDLSRAISPQKLTKYAIILNDGVNAMKGATSERLQLELIIAQMSALENPAVAPAPVSTPAMDTASKPQYDNEPQVATKPQIQPEPAPVILHEVAEPTPAPVNADFDANKWDALLDEIAKVRKSPAVMLKAQGSFGGYANGTLTIHLKTDNFVNTFNNGGYSAFVQQGFQALTGKTTNVQVTAGNVASSPEPVVAPEPPVVVAQSNLTPTQGHSARKSQDPVIPEPPEDIASEPDTVSEPQYDNKPEPVPVEADVDETVANEPFEEVDTASRGVDILEAMLGAKKV